ncbi:MAG: GxxExxY protein [Bacteroidetes bacterium]|nr:GxxExxY protein [Bacteroidota bacterium]MBU2586469.1 GxxExxY protein [Bacteroidota bacterium]
MKFDILSNKILGAAIEVHKHLGPGLLESAYEECLSYELTKLGIHHKRQQPLPLIYKEVKLDHGYRIDILAEDKIIIEIKSVEILSPLHEAQILTYLRFAKKEIGLLINFNVLQLKNGIRRFVMTHI